VHNIRDFATDKHHTTDDTPYGGGAGMIMKIEPIDAALQSLTTTTPRAQQHVIVLSAKGTPLTQAKATQYAALDKTLVLICGRYEGVDQRVIDHLADEELSIGPYVLAGGELAALVVIESVARLIPGVLGNPASLKEESHNEAAIEYPQYTKPEVYKDWRVPEVLLSGDHGAIAQWRVAQSRPTLNSL
jgi:tRNA (guanine37-N1)-methyltransferase